MQFTVEGRPVGKQRARTVRNKYTGRVHSFTPEKTASYEDLIRWKYRETGGEYHAAKTLKISVAAFYPIPKGFNKAKKKAAAEGTLRPAVKPDIDNIAKVVLDALNGVAFCDDKQVVELDISKYYGEFPRLQIEIKELEVNGTD